MTGTESTTRLQDRLAVRDRLRAVLVSAQAERDQRPGMAYLASGNEPAWLVYEWRQMWNAVNEERAALGLGPVPYAEVEDADRLASGHVDYTDKFALYCAELVIEP